MCVCMYIHITYYYIHSLNMCFGINSTRARQYRQIQREYNSAVYNLFFFDWQYSKNSIIFTIKVYKLILPN